MTTTTTTEYRNGDRCAHDYWPVACGICPTPTTAYNLQDELERAEASVSSTIPCPGWCELPAGHAYDVPSLDSTSRMHEREVPARDDAPTMKIWALDSLEATNRELVEAEVGPKDHNRSDPPVRHVPAFTEAMLEAAKLVEEHDQAPWFRLYTDDETDDALARMAAEPIDEERALRGVDSVLGQLVGINLPDSRDYGVSVDAPGGIVVALSPQEDGVIVDTPAVPGGVLLDADAVVNLAAALLRMHVLRGGKTRTGR